MAKAERLHTLQIGALPEQGKARFPARLDREGALVKSRFPNAYSVGIADGAKDNGRFLTPRTKRQTVDFWPAAGYLGQAAEALFEGKEKAMAKRAWLKEACHNLKHKVGAASPVVAGDGGAGAIPTMLKEFPRATGSGHWLFQE